MGNSKTYIVGNWKMHGSAAMAQQLVQAIIPAAENSARATVVVCPPATLLSNVAKQCDRSKVFVGAQDCHVEKSGAFTGDISAEMLKEAGCKYVIVGHSERRAQHGETSEVVRKKAAMAMQNGLIPIICIGETESERAAGKAKEVVEKQLHESIPSVPAGGYFLLAYEPVWAIGSGRAATVDDIRQMHAYILAEVSRETFLGQEPVCVLYGGSVKAANAREILTTPGVSGLLVGGASLKADEFTGIIAAAM